MGTAPKDKGLLSGIRTILGIVLVILDTREIKASYRKDANSPIEAIDFIESKVENQNFLNVFKNRSNYPRSRLYGIFTRI